MEGDDGLLAFLDRGARARNAAHGRVRSELVSGGEDEVAEGEYDECLERGQWFLRAGLREWGEAELESARRHCYDSPSRMLDLAALFDEFAMPWSSVRLYQRARDRMPWQRRGAFAQDFLWLLYPTPYPLQVLENASRGDVAPHLAYAMIREESRFDVGAVSRVGALGLMQIMPETGRWVARELELPGWVESDLLDPEVNVAFGVWYASTLMREADGDPLWMLAAYNAGPGNARRWFAGAEATDAIGAVDNIDFRETRQYVQRIVESANIYHSLYFAPGGAGPLR
jgi:soluble lytic murein transglycosylase